MFIFNLILCLSATISFHVGGTAEHYFTQGNNQLELKIVIDKAELEAFDFTSDCAFKETSAFCLANYINECSEVLINGQVIEFQLDKATPSDHHFNLFLTAPKVNPPINSVSIRNTCFTEFNPEYRNRIIMDLGNWNNSYLLTKTENQLTVGSSAE